MSVVAIPCMFVFGFGLVLHSFAYAGDEISAVGTPDEPKVLEAIVQGLNEGLTPEEFGQVQDLVMVNGKLYYWRIFRFSEGYLTLYTPPTLQLDRRFARPEFLGPDPCGTVNNKYKGMTRDMSLVLEKPYGCVSFYGERHCFAGYYYLCEETSLADQHRIRREREQVCEMNKEHSVCGE